MGERNSYNILIQNPEGKRPLGRRQRENNIKMDFKGTGREGVKWIDLAQNTDQQRALVITLMTTDSLKVAGNITHVSVECTSNRGSCKSHAVRTG
jgi:hypothetical protein